MGRRSFLFLLAIVGQNDSSLPATIVERRVRLVVTDTVDRASELARRERVTLLPDRVRIDDLTFGTFLIVRLDRNLVISGDRADLTFSTATIDQIRARRKEFLEELARARGRLTGAEAEELGAIERGFQEVSEPSISLAPTGLRETFDGRELPEKVLLLDRLQIFKGFLDPEVSEGRHYFEALGRLGSLHPAAADALVAAGGFPRQGVLRYTLVLKRIESTERVLSVRREYVAPSLFDAPTGWKKIPFPDVEEEPLPELPEKFEKRLTGGTDEREPPDR